VHFVDKCCCAILMENIISRLQNKNMNAASVLVYAHCTHFPLLTVQGVGMCEHELREKARKEKAALFLYVRSHSYNF